MFFSLAMKWLVHTIVVTVINYYTERDRKRENYLKGGVFLGKLFRKPIILLNCFKRAF
jgi:hypothetical protein